MNLKRRLQIKTLIQINKMIIEIMNQYIPKKLKVIEKL